MKPFSDGGTGFDEGPELPLAQEIAETDQGMPMLKLPALRGSEKQIRYAQSLRATALALTWPRPVAAKLSRIVDASWWIGNRFDLPKMKFKEPVQSQMASPDQIVSGESGFDDVPYDPKYDPRIHPAEMNPPEKRLGDAGAFAASASGSPRLAEAAIIAVLSRLYKDEMRDGLRQRAKQLVDQFEADTARDIAAIRKMIE